MICHFAKKCFPVVPIAGVLCIGYYLNEEVQYQTRNYINKTPVVKKEIDEEYKEIIYKYFFH